jgi:DNA-binding transcriptional regulator YhcF (GntR family)
MVDLKIRFGDNQSVPKYRLIIDAIEKKIALGDLKKGNRLPSLKSLCNQYDLSQDTVLVAYNELKAKGIITSRVGKGYFILNENTGFKHRVLLLFDKLTAYKEDMLSALENEFDGDATIQIFFHHNDIKMFRSVIEGAVGEFTEYVIMPFDHPDVKSLIEKLPSSKVFILDQGRKQYKSAYSYVCQDFERDIYRILKKNNELVEKYSRMVLVIRNQKSHYRDIARGFRDYCRQHPVPFDVVNEIKLFDIKKGDAFIVVDDRDLEHVVRHSIENKYTLGEQLGIISYNETSLKGIIANGITTISTDFAGMGKTMASIILNNQKTKIDNPFIINLRKSF